MQLKTDVAFNEYYGIVLPDKDPLDQGRYLVYIPELQQAPDLRMTDGLWCINGLSNFKGYRNKDNQPILTGNYRPIPPGAAVVVRMSQSGSNNPTIIRMAPTNINTPDGKKRDSLYVVEQTPQGDSIEIDTDLGYLALRYHDGKSSVVLKEDSIFLELNTAGTSKTKEKISGIEITHDHIRFHLRDITMELNASGFGVKFSAENSSYFKMTKNTFEVHTEESVNINAKKSVSILGNKTTISGTSDMSIRGSDTRITGSQKMSMNGNQVAIDGFNTVQLKSNLHIGMQSKVKMTQECMLFDETILGIKNSYASVNTETTNVKSIATSTYSMAASTMLQDSQVVSNMGVGAGVTGSLNPANEATMKSVQLGLATTGTIFLLNNSFTAAASLAISETIAGVATYADAPVGQGTLFGVHDKKDRTSPVSVLNTAISKRNADLMKYSTIPEAAAGGAKSLLYRYNA